jgi:hypothetical protein
MPEHHSIPLSFSTYIPGELTGPILSILCWIDSSEDGATSCWWKYIILILFCLFASWGEHKEN